MDGSTDTTNVDKQGAGSGKSTGRMVAAATGLMIITVGLSRLLGFVRESLLMAYFGQGALTDVYKQSFVVPDTLYFLIAGGALSSAFIPVFTKYTTNGNDEDAWKTFSVVACTAFLITSIFVIVGEIWAVPLSRLISPGFTQVQVEQMAYLTRIILPAQAFFFLGGLMMGTLYSKHKFLAPAFGPLIYTIGIIAGGLITAQIHQEELRLLHSPEIVQAMRVWANPSNTPQALAAKEAVKPLVDTAIKVGTPVVSGYSWGALIGAFIGNFCIQLYAMRRIGMRFKPSLDIRHEGARQVFILMLPVILGLSLPQVDVQLNKYFATLLSAGSVTALDNANRLMQVPYGVLGTAFAVALFPTLSALAAQELWPDFRSQISQGVRRVVFMALPASTLLMVLSIPCVRLVFQHGSLVTNQDTYITALTLVLFSIGIPSWCIQAMIARGFYSLHDSKTVVITGTIMTVIFVGLSVGLVKLLQDPKATWWAPAGLACITTITASMHAFILMWMLKGRIGGIDGRNVAVAISKMVLASVIMAVVSIPVYLGFEHYSAFSALLRNPHAGDMKRTMATMLEIAVVGGVGFAAYAAAAKILKLSELESAAAMIKGKFRRKRA